MGPCSEWQVRHDGERRGRPGHQWHDRVGGLCVSREEGLCVRHAAAGEVGGGAEDDGGGSGLKGVLFYGKKGVFAGVV